MTWPLFRTAWVDATTVVLGLVSLLLLFVARLNPAWIVIGAGLMGVLAGWRT